ncbi:oligosaccharide biosynthesis protein Alg14 [Halomonas aquamarina]|uniref:Oligosaccharide biosynthesis protein Alg14 n=1 Tax=Vreelandella aquamarina TaxID=77097 RepID=A0ACC5VS01_9GAMM|nr:oligosaccharide biosynthesis protein Alg14 [Halomonas aquamarina]MBZ5486432.1 oligosaccharide biosynthesis protein Alg14 [Halomonas aquamarina]
MKILLVASFGGHFIQLKRLFEQMQNFISENVTYEFAVTEKDITINGAPAIYLPNVHRESGLKEKAVSFYNAYKIFKKVKPDVVISTGALPGLIMCFIAKLFGKKVIWVDSMANYQKLSFSGRIAKFFCSVCLTQWEHLAENDKRVTYWGKVL